MEASSSTGSKGEWSPEKAKDLYCLLNKRIKREKRRKNKEEKRGVKIMRGDRGWRKWSQGITRNHSNRQCQEVDSFVVQQKIVDLVH